MSDLDHQHWTQVVGRLFETLCTNTFKTSDAGAEGHRFMASEHVEARGLGLYLKPLCCISQFLHILERRGGSVFVGSRVCEQRGANLNRKLLEFET